MAINSSGVMILWWDKNRQYHLEEKQGVYQSYILPHVSFFVCTFKTSDGMIMLGTYRVESISLEALPMMMGV